MAAHAGCGRSGLAVAVAARGDAERPPESDAPDARALDAGTALDAGLPVDLGTAAGRDAYLPREPPPATVPGVCAGTASMRRIYAPAPEDRPGGRTTIGAVRWGDGLLVEWADSAAARWSTHVGRIAEPVAGAVDLALSWTGEREAVFLPTAEGGMRLVHPGVYQEVEGDRLGPEDPLPPPPAGMSPPHPIGACVGIEAVDYRGGGGDGRGDSTALLRFEHGVPRWSDSAPVAGVEHQLCVATRGGVSQVWRDGGTILVQQWDVEGRSLGPPLRVEARGSYAEVVVVEEPGGAYATLVALWGSDDPSRDWVLASLRLVPGGIDAGPSATLARTGTWVRLHGATRVGGRIVAMVANPLLATVELDPETGVAGPLAIVGEHPCWSASRAVALPTGLYLPLDCYFEEIWLLRVCGGSS